MRKLHTFLWAGPTYFILVVTVLTIFFPNLEENTETLLFRTAGISTLPSILLIWVFPFKKMCLEETPNTPLLMKRKVEEAKIQLGVPFCLIFVFGFFHGAITGDFTKNVYGIAAIVLFCAIWYITLLSVLFYGFKFTKSKVKIENN